jgi:hypothetical protein
MKIKITLIIILAGALAGCKPPNVIKKESKDKQELKSFQEVKTYYLNNQTDKDKLKMKMIQTVLNNPEEQSDLFALFILNSDKPFFFLGGASYSEIGKYVEPELFKKVCLHLISKLENSTDLLFDIQQIGRWVNHDFVPRNSNMKKEEKIEWMVNTMMDYFDHLYGLK